MSEPVTIAFDEAVKLLPEGDAIHTIIDGGAMHVGADWPRASILTALRAAKTIFVTGGMARGTGHGLAIFHDGQRLFIMAATPEWAK